MLIYFVEVYYFEIGSSMKQNLTESGEGEDFCLFTGLEAGVVNF